MYSTTDSIVRSIKIADINKKLIDSAYDSMIENMKLIQGIAPVPVEDRPSPFDNRDEVMAAIKTITYEPRKFFAMLYDAYQVDLFAQRLPEFLRYIGKYRTNLSAEKLYSEWQKFITLTIDKDLEIKGVPREEIQAYNINLAQTKGRTDIRTRERLETKEIDELESIEKKMNELSRRLVRANVMGDSSWMKLSDELAELDKRRKKILTHVNMDLRTAEEPFNPVQRIQARVKKNKEEIQKSLATPIISRAIILSQIERIDNEISSMKRYVDQSEGKISKTEFTKLVKKEEKLQAEKSKLNNMLHNY